MKRPNLLFIMADQLRWDTVGQDSTWVATPNLDALASEGILYSNCITNAPVCKPARVSLATGLYPHNTGCWYNDRFELGAKQPNWMRVIRNQGYRTALFGKLHLHRRHDDDLRVDEALVQQYGFDVVNEIVGPRGCAVTHSHMTALWDELDLWQPFQADLVERLQKDPLAARPGPLPLEHYYDVYIARRAREWLQQYAEARPWFCKLSFAGPHEPWDAPEPYASRYDAGAMPAPAPRMAGSEQLLRSELRQRFADSPGFAPEAIARCRANYAGNVTLIDDQIGEVIDTIKARGEWDNTVVVFTADHGEMNGDHGLVHKNTFLDGATRVPLILRLPPALRPDSAPVCNDGMVELMDVGATLADFAGKQPPFLHFARSCKRHLDAPASPLREAALAGFKGEMLLVTREYKLAINRFGEPYMLLDRLRDPGEQHNLVADTDYAGALQTLQATLLQRLITAQAYRPPAPRGD